MPRGREAPALTGPEGLRQLRKQLATGWPPGLTVLNGGDLFHLDLGQRELLKTLLPADASEMALTVYGEQRIDLSTVVASARSLGMFASRRVVLVRELQALEGDPEPLSAYAANPPSKSYLLIRAPVLDRRRKLHQVLVTCGRLLRFDAADPQRAASLAGDVLALGRERGLTVDRPAAVLLAELCAGDFYRIVSELEKIRAWLGGPVGATVDIGVVREVAAGSGLLSGWEVASALARQDRAAALAAVRRLLDAGDEPLRLLGGVAYKARGMLQAKAMIARGLAAPQALHAARLYGDDPAQLAEGLRRFRLEDLVCFPSYLLEADRTLKSRSIAPRAVLERLIDRMIPAGQDRIDRG